LFALLGLIYLLLPAPPDGFGWLPWAYLAVAGLWAFDAWGTAIAWIDVGPSDLRIHYNSRTRKVPMNDVLAVEAHRHPRIFPGRSATPAYEIRIRRPKGRPWGLGYIEPAAGERLLWALYRNKRPITVYDWT